MSDSELLDFLSNNYAEVGFRDNLYSVLVPGWHGGVWCIVSSGHNVSLRAAIQACADRLYRQDHPETVAA